MSLLTRDEFRNQVFSRDKNKCVMCGAPAKDAHHIVERRLWPDGGYYMSNGASVCEACHLKAESTILTCDELRERCGIKEVLLPPHFYSDQPIDKWGNPILPNGQRLKGELFNDESVQKIMKPVLHLFTNRIKHPRTHHLPWSPGVNDDDKIIQNLAGFERETIIATVKMDGEQTSMYRDGFHARSIDTPSHPSRDWLWAIHREVGHDIPEGWRICGENLYAKHSIHYMNLTAYFQVFAIWNEKNECLSWEETCSWSELLGLKTVDVFYQGPWNEALLRKLAPERHRGDPCEGYVARVARSFSYREFKDVVAKFVRKDHVQTHGHWMRQAMVKNEVAKG